MFHLMTNLNTYKYTRFKSVFLVFCFRQVRTQENFHSKTSHIMTSLEIMKKSKNNNNN